jgi:hypothetical protein
MVVDSSGFSPVISVDAWDIQKNNLRIKFQMDVANFFSGFYTSINLLIA